METLFYSRMSSPAGPLLIGASETALVILEFDRGLPQSIAGRAGSLGGITLANCRNADPTGRVFCGEAQTVHHAAGSAWNGISQALLEGAAAHSLRRNPHLCRDRARRRIARQDSAPSVRPITTIPSRSSSRAIACWRPASVWAVTAADSRSKRCCLSWKVQSFAKTN